MILMILMITILITTLIIITMITILLLLLLLLLLLIIIIIIITILSKQVSARLPSDPALWHLTQGQIVSRGAATLEAKDAPEILPQRISVRTN